jgi:tetratricopeptide (TPR) repeat protein/TolB-like protein
MSSLIPGYEYDIFISYRQKDNKGDKWVSKFVDALKTELEATFKEDVSVYFDENPHDRLQETHNVSKSLEGKLKCLIFIPILSQTYCDPNSFAWQFEFLAFLRIAEQDHFGKDIKLRSGNVASRILPIRIHDLEEEDIKLFEKETGSVLRALDFVFKTSTGVSRPLKTNEDHPHDNLNKTFFSDQINKVAHAIKEIVLGMKTGSVNVPKETGRPVEPEKEIRENERISHPVKPAKAVSGKIISTIGVLSILIIAGILAFPKIFNRSPLDKLKSSGEKITVAVMPFQNMTNDTSWNVWQNSIQDMLITNLSNASEELKVRQVESINRLVQSKGSDNYASITPSVGSSISQKLNANLFVYGNIKQSGNTIRIYAQLADSKTEEIIKPFVIECSTDEKNTFKIIDSLSVMVKDFLIMSKLIKKGNPDFIKYEATTTYPEAFKFVLSGNYEFYTKLDYPAAINMYMQAIAIDSNYIWPAIMISYAYMNQTLYQQGKEWFQKIYKKRDQMPLYFKTYANIMNAYYNETPYETIKYFRQLLEIDDQLPDVYTDIGTCYIGLGQHSNAIPEYEKALEIYEKWGTKPLWVFNYTMLGTAYHKTGQYKKEEKLYKKAEKDFPGHYMIQYLNAILQLTVGDTILANKSIEKVIAWCKENSYTKEQLAAGFAQFYSAAGLFDKAEEYYRQSLSFQPESPAGMNNLAYFLINNDRNINEGLELIDKALIKRPDNYNFLHTKGWGVYKQGNYREALEILQKSWDLRLKNAVYNHEAFLHLEAAKKAVEGLK